MRVRFVLAFIVVVMVAILAVTVFVRLDSQRQVQTYLFGGGMMGAQSLVTSLDAYYNSTGSWKGAETVIQAFLHDPSMMGTTRTRLPGFAGLDRSKLVDTNGKVVFDLSGRTVPGIDIPPDQLGLGINLTDKSGRTAGYLLLDNPPPFRQGDEAPLLRNLGQAVIRGGLVGLGLALIAALLVSGTLLRPIRRLTQAAENMAAGDLNQQVPVKGRDELASLGKAFNTMVDSLRRSEERRKAITADIAHELRTPLAVQRAQLEALQDGIYPLTAENLQPVLDQTDLLARLVDDMRMLALADAGELTLEKRAVELAPWLENQLQRFRSSAEQHQISLELKCESNLNHASIQADPDRLAQIMNNLLSNALRHTPQGGRVEVLLGAAQELMIIRVHDSGPGIPADSLEQVFERFYRADKSRSRDEGGSGLGLAIARQFTLAHGGSLEAANDPSGGAIFTLIFPRVGSNGS